MRNLGMYCKALLLPAILFASLTLAGSGEDAFARTYQPILLE
jgi:hypothetical protein